ncbi:MAG: ABC transporter substrate-binding protein [Bacillota bacterium]
MRVRVLIVITVVTLVLIVGITRDNALHNQRTPIRIGFLATLSGPSSELGVSGRNAVALAVKLVNDAGGLLGRPVEIVAKDLRANRAQDVMAQFVDERVNLVIGPYRSDGMDFDFSDPRLLVLSPTVANRKLDGIDDNLIRFIEPAEAQGEVLASYIGGDPTSTRIAIIADMSNEAYTSELVLAFTLGLKDQKKEIVFQRSYHEATASDCAEWSQTISQLGADAVLVVSDAPGAAMMAQQLRKIGWTGRILTGMWSMTQDLQQYGGQAVEGTTACGVCDPESSAPRYLAFRDHYTAIYGSEPSFSAVLSYEVADTLFQAIADYQSLDPAIVKSALVGKQLLGLQSSYLIDRYGDPERPYQLFMVRDRIFRRVP